MDIPKFHSFPSPFLEKGGNDLAECEISVLKKDDIAWCIVMSYLMNRESRMFATKEYQRRISRLIDCDDDFLRNVERSVLRYNPFQNRWSCFHDEYLKKVVTSFTEKLQWTSLSIKRKLQAASNLLLCSIVKITKTDEPEIELIFPSGIDEKNQSITLFQSDKTGSNFSFGIQKEIGLKLQKKAFVNALECAELHPKFIRKFLKITNEKDPFIIAVLKSDCNCKDFIPQLYQSSYALHKLSEAGFETDPTVEDKDGYPALLHALTCYKHPIVYSLFLHVCNANQKSSGTYREPDANVITSLRTMSVMLNTFQDKLDAPKFQEKKRKLMLKIQELSLLNQFLINVSFGNNKLENEESSENTDYLEERRRKNKIMCILNTYEEFFMSKKRRSGTSAFNDYKQKKVFYKMLDSICAMMFFDNIFLLKDILKMEDKSLYSGIESFFYLAIRFDHMIFPHCRTLYSLNNKRVSNDSLCLISFFLRMVFKEMVINFRNELYETKIEESKILKCVPEDEIFRAFHDFPEIRDEVLIRKLKFYLDTALKVEVEDMKSVLVIERALQVIEEDIIFSKQPKSVRRLLALSISAKQLSTLKQLRHQMCHLEESSYFLKLKAETDIKLFRDIKQEILKLKEAFTPIMDLEDYSVTHCVVNFVGKLIKEVHQNQTKHTQFRGFDFKKLTESWNTVIMKSNVLWKKRLQTIIRNHFLKFKIVFENIFQCMEEALQEDSFWKSDKCKTVDFVAKAKEVAWPVQFLLTIFNESAKFNMPESVTEMCKEEWLNDNCHTEADARGKIEELLASSRIFASFFDIPKDKKCDDNFSIINIKKFKKTHKGVFFLTEEEKSHIRNEVPPLVRTAREKVLESMETGNSLELKELHDCFKSLMLSKNKLDELKKKYRTDRERAKSIVEASDNPVDELEKVLSKNSVQQKTFTMLDDVMHFSDETKLLLSNLIEGKKREIPSVNKLSVILNRICALRSILLEECPEINNLWKSAKSQKAKEYAVHKITQRFMQDSLVRASSEMLLFESMHCIQATEEESKDKEKILTRTSKLEATEEESKDKEKILTKTSKLQDMEEKSKDKENILTKKTKLEDIEEESKDKENILTKTSKLYSGITLHNALAHGCPMLENIGLLLDFEDIPSAFVMKMLQFIEDEPTLKLMYESGLDFCMFHKMMNSDDDENKDLRSSISKCKRWESYSYLIPEKHEKPCEEKQTSFMSVNQQEKL